MSVAAAAPELGDLARATDSPELPPCPGKPVPNPRARADPRVLPSTSWNTRCLPSSPSATSKTIEAPCGLWMVRNMRDRSTAALTPPPRPYHLACAYVTACLCQRCDGASDALRCCADLEDFADAKAEGERERALEGQNEGPDGLARYRLGSPAAMMPS
eukprot:CAMPEP_0206223330 /NCGR_PEP_ID=MMETSP0047_2-20121206/6428_1 /ASSEMBLY_ACC=CAM_ASM_000192 /TAXON_ID=195065 /ORGANISM="Chroomonas mesostigmatica_cf, Strain CCMP1168" /LENGTH=158 /DNA_ID=CAMNT_0053646199 /DNA_START=152 /DNA_END=628 /DNA_ORIENTATION=-